MSAFCQILLQHSLKQQQQQQQQQGPVHLHRQYMVSAFIVGYYVLRERERENLRHAPLVIS